MYKVGTFLGSLGEYGEHTRQPSSGSRRLATLNRSHTGYLGCSRTPGRDPVYDHQPPGYVTGSGGCVAKREDEERLERSVGSELDDSTLIRIVGPGNITQ